MANKAFEIIKAVRPIHWVKNISLFAALVFTGNLLNEALFITVTWAFVVFSIAASATYLFNDVLDAKSDSLHPLKKKRPVASGQLSPTLALLIALVLATISFYLAFQLNFLFFVAILAYLILQALYSLGLKNLPVIDILIIATGFIIRVYAGAFVIDAHLSVWFLLCVVSVALFLASGKRRAELNIVRASKLITRKSLIKYKRELLNSYVTMFGNAAWMSWALFTFFESPKSSRPVWIFLAELSSATAINKLLMITTPVVIFIIMRYEALIFEGRSEVPEKILLTDPSLLAAIGLWSAMIVWILYSSVATTGI